MPLSKIKPLDRTTSTSVPDYIQALNIKTTTRSNSQYSYDQNSPRNQPPIHYFARQTEQCSTQRVKSLSESMNLSLSTQTQQVYQRMNDLYIARQVKLKLKQQEQQIKDCVFKKKKENFIKNSFVKLMSMKDKQKRKSPKHIQESHFLLQEFDSFRKVI